MRETTMDAIKRDESKMHMLPSVIPMLCLIDMPVCLVSLIAIVINLIKLNPNESGFISGLLPETIVFVIGMAFSYFADNFYNWFLGYTFDPAKRKASYRVPDSFVSAKDCTTVSFREVTKIKQSKGQIIVKGEIEKRVPRQKPKILKKYVIPRGFTKEQQEQIIASLTER